MIPLGLIVIAALIAGGAVALAGGLARWPAAHLAVAGVVTVVAVVAWRLLANALSLNEDFMPAVSVGDAVCLLAGGLPPAVVAGVDRELPRRAVPVITGALVAFAANVIIL